MSQRLRSQPMWVDVLECFACRQAHFLEKSGGSWVVAEIFQQRIVFDRGQPAVSLFVGTFQPIERFVGLPAKRIHLSNLIGGTIVILRDKPGQGSIRILITAERVISQCLARKFPPLGWFLFNFCERLLRLSFSHENFTQIRMDKGSLRVQFQSSLELGPASSYRPAAYSRYPRRK